MADLLPPELWSIAFNQLQYQDLSKVDQVCKLFHAITQQPKLHQELFHGMVISTLTSYYRFLSTMYLPTEDICFPPDGGWPKATKQKYAGGDKTNDVIELVRQLPYIRTPSCNGQEIRHIHWDTVCNSEWGEDPVPEEAILPPGTICIAQPPHRDGYYIFLDTERETVMIDGSPDEWDGRGTLQPQVSYDYEYGRFSTLPAPAPTILH